ncbi:MAG: ubiquinol-cytochrome c reductase iron-sulfur subunit [Gammaproteobacteria bacterium]|nr:MAG: ubiquinol-cytochrome c reductase iron-sulfur subunit [Gammaproteobacteria bacterium]
MSDQIVNKGRRRMLVLTTSAIGAVGVGFAAAPFILSMTPSARARAAGAPVEVDFSKLDVGVLLTIEWQGKPIWIVKRTDAMLEKLGTIADILVDPDSNVESQQPAYTKNLTRSQEKYSYISVMIGICTHLGCVPFDKFPVGHPSGMGADWPGGYFCVCHGSKFDMAGRVFKNVPAPTNLVIPPYRYITETQIVVGVHPEGYKG